MGKFDCQMGFALETGQEMGFFCLFRLGQRIVGTGGLNRHGRMSMLRVAGFGQFANPKVGLVGPCRQVVERWVWWVVPGRQVVTRCFWSDWMGGCSLLCFFAVEGGVFCVCV